MEDKIDLIGKSDDETESESEEDNKGEQQETRENKEKIEKEEQQDDDKPNIEDNSKTKGKNSSKKKSKKIEKEEKGKESKNSKNSKQKVEPPVSKKPKIKLIKRKATKQLMIHDQPPILVLHIKRFMQTWIGSFEKIDKYIPFPMMLNLNPYCTNDTEKDATKKGWRYLYRLTGVVVHGGGLNSGHYIAYVRKQLTDSGDDDAKGSSKSKWFYFSDTHYSEVPESEVLSKQAYLLFYQRIDLMQDRDSNVGQNASVNVATEQEQTMETPETK
jgi:hypothetical protein